MASPWVSRGGGAAALLLLFGALVSLQLLVGGSRLVYELPAFGVIALAALIASLARRPDAKIDVVCFATAALFCAYIVVRAVLSPAPYHARPDLYGVLAAFTVYGLTATRLDYPRARMALLAGLLAFAVCHVVISLVQFGLGENFIFVPALEDLAPKNAASARSARASGLYISPNNLAGLLEVLGVFGLSIACWSRWPKWARVLAGYLALICYIGVAFTGSRGGYLSVGVSLLVFGLLSLIALRSGGAALFLKWGGLGILGVIVAVWIGGSLMRESASITQRLEKITATDEGRLGLWRAAIDQWRLQPWTGTGSGTYRFYGRQFRDEKMQQDPVTVHNDYLELLAEYGVFGAGAFLLFFASHVRRGWRSFVVFGPQRLAAGVFPLGDRLALNIGALSAISAYVVHSAFDFNMHIPANALLLAFAFGILANPGSGPTELPSAEIVTRIPRFAVATVATILFIQCVRLLPGEYYAHRARLELEDERASAAIELANKALKYEQSNPRIFFYLGRAFSAIGDDKVRQENRVPYYEAALAAFEKARLLNPLDGSYPWDMAILYDRLGRFAEAEWMYGIARNRDPRSRALSARYRTHLRLWQSDR